MAPSVASTPKNVDTGAAPTATLGKIPKKQAPKGEVPETLLKSAAKAKEKFEKMKAQKNKERDKKKLAPVSAKGTPSSTLKSKTELPHPTRPQSSSSLPQPSANAIKQLKERKNVKMLSKSDRKMLVLGRERSNNLQGAGGACCGEEKKRRTERER